MCEAFAADRVSIAAQLGDTQGEVEAPRESSARQASILQRATAQRDRHRGERDTLRAVRIALSSTVPRSPHGVRVFKILMRVAGTALQLPTDPRPLLIHLGVGPNSTRLRFGLSTGWRRTCRHIPATVLRGGVIAVLRRPLMLRTVERSSLPMLP